MIRPININLNAAHPELKLLETVTYTGSPSSVFIRGIPPNYGRWAITAVFVAASFPDGSTTTRAAVRSADGVWVATLPATATSGRTENGFRVIADGIDENGEAVTGYIIAVADFAVASLDVTPAPEPGETSYQMLYFDEVPSTLRKGDVTKIDGVLKFYNGSAWEPFAAPVTLDDTVTPSSANGVKSSGIWSALWGTATTAFSSVYDWIVDKLSEYRDKADLAVYGLGNASVTFPEGYSITYEGVTYRPGGTGGISEKIQLYGPIESTAVPQYIFWVPAAYKDDTNFDPSRQYAWCMYADVGSATPRNLMYGTGASFTVSNWNTDTPTLTLSYGEETGGHPTMARPVGATGDTLAKVSQLAGKVPTSRTVNGKALSSDVTLTGADIPVDATQGAPKINAALAGKVSTSGDDMTGPLYNRGEEIEPMAWKSKGIPRSGPAHSVFGPNGICYEPAYENAISGTEHISKFRSDKDGFFAFLEDIASDYSDETVYTVGQLATVDGVLKKCTTAGTGGLAVFSATTLEDVLAALRTGKQDALTQAQLDNIAAVPNKADASTIPYSLGTPIVIDSASSETVEGETVYFGAATLANRTANIVQVTTQLDELRITFPAATSGKVRDFGLRVEIGTGSAELAAPALVPIAPTGETIKIENADGTIPALADGTATAKGVTLLYFSETAPGVFVVKGEQVEEVA